MQQQLHDHMQQSAGKVMMYCVNRMVDTILVQGWEHWVGLMMTARNTDSRRKSAAKVLDRSLRHMRHLQHSAAWNQWRDVLAYEHHCGRVMNRSLRHMTNWQYSAAWGKWRAVLLHKSNEERHASMV